MFFSGSTSTIVSPYSFATFLERSRTSGVKAVLFTRKEVKLIDKYIAEKLPRNDQNVYDPKALGPADFKNTTNIKMICHKELWNMFCMKGMATIEGSSP